MKAKSLGERDSKTSRTPWHWQKELLDRESFKRERCLGENRRQQSPLLIGKIKWCEAPAGSALRLLSWLTASCAVFAGLLYDLCLSHRPSSRRRTWIIGGIYCVRKGERWPHNPVLQNTATVTDECVCQYLGLTVLSVTIEICVLH